MTKQQIKDLVTAKIAGQGTNVDAGGGLPIILNEIIDAIPEGGNDPVIVEGEFDSMENTFVPTSADFDEVAAKFNSGVPVVLKGELDSIPVQLLVTEYSNDAGGDGEALWAQSLSNPSSYSWVKS